MRRILLLSASSICLSLLLWAFWLEPDSLTQAHIDVSLSHWSADCQGLRIVLLADLHVGAPFIDLDKLAKIVQISNAQQPDLILLAGDYVIQGVVGGQFVPPDAIAKQLALLTAPLGVYAVLGNHDWWHDAGEIAQTFEQHGITLLEDKAIPLSWQQCEFWLAGISDYWEGLHDVNQALQDIPAQATNLLVFTHNPDVFDDIPDRVSLTLAGHTHGGQVYLPLVGRPIVPSVYGQRFAIGHIQEGRRHLYVNPGIGTSILPVRFGVPPQISVLRLYGEVVP